MVRRNAVAVTITALGTVSTLTAQTLRPPPPVVADEIVVTATLEPEKQKRLPATVEQIGAEELAARATGDALALLRTVAGVAAVQSGSPGKQASLFVRGANSNQTLVIWNGVELNDPAFGGFDWALLSTDGLERIEVVRGPFSAVWGSSAMGGVVQLVTRAAEKPAATLRLESGSNAFRRVQLDARRTFGPVGVNLAGHLRRGDGELPNDLFESEEIVLRSEWSPSEASRIGALVRRVDAEIGLPFDFFGQPSPHRRQPVDSTTWAVPVRWSDQRWQIESTVSQIESEISLVDADDPFAASATAAHRESARSVVRRRLSELGWLAVGGEWERETASSTSAFGPGLERDRQRTRSLFAQSRLAKGQLAAELGARSDEYDRFGSETSLRGGIVWQPHQRVRLRTSYGESFRAPSLGELFFPGFSNPDLLAEQGESLELGVELETERARFELTGFENGFDDLILFDFATFVPRNIGRARSRGVEAGFRASFEALTLRAAGTWLDARDLGSGRPLPRRPEWSGHLLIAYVAERISGSAALRFVGAREDVGDVALPSYSVLDLHLSFSAHRAVEPYLRVENLLDRRYQEVAGFPAPGRSWVGGLRLRVGG